MGYFELRDTSYTINSFSIITYIIRIKENGFLYLLTREYQKGLEIQNSYIYCYLVICDFSNLFWYFDVCPCKYVFFGMSLATQEFGLWKVLSGIEILDLFHLLTLRSHNPWIWSDYRFLDLLL